MRTRKARKYEPNDDAATLTNQSKTNTQNNKAAVAENTQGKKRADPTQKGSGGRKNERPAEQTLPGTPTPEHGITKLEQRKGGQRLKKKGERQAQTRETSRGNSQTNQQGAAGKSAGPPTSQGKKSTQGQEQRPTVATTENTNHVSQNQRSQQQHPETKSAKHTNRHLYAN